MARNIGLGRGLDALLGGATLPGTLANDENTDTINETKANADEVVMIDPHLLDPNPEQPRKDFDAEAMAELSRSIKEHGVVQPIIAEAANGGRYYIIAGERRAKAAIMAGLSEVPVLLRKYSDDKRLEIALIENIQRADLNPIDEAAAYARLMSMANLNQDELAARVGKNRSTVANAMRLLQLSDEMKSALRGGAITAGHARALLSVEDERAREALFHHIIEKKLSVREAEKAAKAAESTQAGGGKGKGAKRDPDIMAIEQRMLERLGNKSRINGTLEKGKIEIDYYNRADLDRLCELLTKE